MRRGPALAGAGLALVIAIAGCSLITSYDEFDHASAPVAAVCGSAIPPPPANLNPGGKENEVLGVTSDFTILDAFDGGGPALGYNLDGLCTCPGKTACTSTPGVDTCDKPAGSGIDNASADLLKYLFLTSTSQENDVLLSLHSGRWGLLVDVQDYNGKSDDGTVTVAVFNVAGLRDRTTASFDGQDVFLVDGNSVANPNGDGASKYVTTDAYVTGGVLVAPFSELFVNILVPSIAGVFGTRVQIPFHSAFLVGKLSSNGNGGLIMQHAQVVGRVASADMLAQVRRLGGCTTPVDGGIAIAPLKATLCSHLDITSGNMPNGTTAPCDAISFAVGFDIAPALKAPGPYPILDPSPGPCPPTDPVVNCDPP